VPSVDGQITLSTQRSRDGEAVRGALHLEPFEAVIATAD
jgi:hypothetical protein